MGRARDVRLDPRDARAPRRRRVRLSLPADGRGAGRRPPRGPAAPRRDRRARARERRTHRASGIERLRSRSDHRATEPAEGDGRRRRRAVRAPRERPPRAHRHESWSARPRAAQQRRLGLWTCARARRRPGRLARASAGVSKVAKIAMTASTTSSSISVKAARLPEVRRNSGGLIIGNVLMSFCIYD